MRGSHERRLDALEQSMNAKAKYYPILKLWLTDDQREDGLDACRRIFADAGAGKHAAPALSHDPPDSAAHQPVDDDDEPRRYALVQGRTVPLELAVPEVLAASPMDWSLRDDWENA